MPRMIKCANCGKEFMHNPQSIYKVSHGGKVHKCCSYGCMNSLRKDLNIKEVRRIK